MSGQSAARRVFSGIQPTGSLHLGNYLGAVRRWVRDVEATQEERASKIFCVVDLHAITLPQEASVLRDNIRKMTATLLACGMDTERCILFQQSAVKEHAELAWILGCHATLPSLGRLTQYKEKAAKLKETPLGLFVYPVLQAADILLYKGTHVPVGDDNVQNVQVAQDLSRSFNRRAGRKLFPRPEIVLLEDAATSRVRSLRNPAKKMSKSDPDWRSCVYVTDPPDVVAEKFKKALTDFEGSVTYEPERRPGVANLVSIHAAMAGKTTEEVLAEAEGLNTGQYKLVVAEAVNERLKPIRERADYYAKNPDFLQSTLQEGASFAGEIAARTMDEVKELVGLR